ncbi:MAG: regulatory signaling modulator protein AmpE [Gammaproteobacteria bacterium]
MSFLIVLIAVGLEFGVGGFAALRSGKWSADWSSFVEHQRSAFRWLKGWVIVVILLGVPTLAAALLFAILEGISGLLAQLAGLATLLLMLGPEDLGAELEQFQRSQRDREAYTNASFLAAATGTDIGEPTGDAALDQSRAHLAALALAADRAWYQPLFWFFVLGPVAVIFYRLISNLRHTEQAESDHAAMQKIDFLRDWLEYLPSRISGFCFGIAGSLVPVIEVLRSYLFSGHSAGTVVAQSALAAIEQGRLAEVIGGDVDVYRMNLMMAMLKRAVIVWLVLLALLALVFS